MFKLNYGGIMNPENGEHREIEVSMLKPNTIKDGVIGCGIVFLRRIVLGLIRMWSCVIPGGLIH